MAQHASPNVAGQMLLRRAHLTTSSSVPVRKLWSNPSRPGSRSAMRHLLAPFEADAPDRGLRRTALVHGKPPDAPGWSPVEAALGDEPREGDHERDRELGDDGEGVAAEVAVRDRPREQE